MKLAVIFPGIGYHTDKPLLYYSKKLALKQGYEIKEVPYGGFALGIKGSKEKMKQAYYSAREQAETILKDVDFEQYDTILFISKSIGTVVAVSYAEMHQLRVTHILYTPVEATFAMMRTEINGIAFHGTSDSWVETDIVIEGCKEKQIPLYITEGTNHSLETGDVETDLQNLQLIMQQSVKMIL